MEAKYFESQRGDLINFTIDKMYSDWPNGDGKFV